jgi:hypothetical protein
MDYAINLGLNNFYLPHYYDFRGRVYSRSILHPISNKFARSLLVVKQFDNNYEGLKNSRFLKELVSSQNYKQSVQYLALNLEDFQNLADLSQALIIIYLVELGKEYKSEMIGENYRLSIFDFVIKGLQIFKNPIPIDADLDEALHLKKFIKAIISVLHGDITP